MNKLMTLAISAVLGGAIGATITGAAVAGAPMMQNSTVTLQASTPGTAQTGNINVTGTILGGRLGIGGTPTLNKLRVVETGANGAASISAFNNALFAESTTTTGTFATGIFRTNSNTGTGVLGDARATTGTTFAGDFVNLSSAGRGVRGRATSATGTTFGGQFSSTSPAGTGVQGSNSSTTGSTFGGDFSVASSTGIGVRSIVSATTGVNFGGFFSTPSTSGTALFGRASSTSNQSLGSGVIGETASTRAGNSIGVGVLGRTTSTAGNANGVVGQAIGSNQVGVFGFNTATSGNSVGGFFQTGSPTGTALFAAGNFSASGTKNFVIDHPMDPANYSLYHSCMEGPEAYNIYRGSASLDNRGEAWIELPEYFQAINANPSYQLTAVGAAMPNLHVSIRAQNNRFKVSGGVAGAQVDWQVTGVRNDPGFSMRGYKTVKPKVEGERGKYWFPEAYGHGPDAGIGFKLTPSVGNQ